MENQATVFKSDVIDSGTMDMECDIMYFTWVPVIDGIILPVQQSDIERHSTFYRTVKRVDKVCLVQAVMVNFLGNQTAGLWMWILSRA